MARKNLMKQVWFHFSNSKASIKFLVSKKKQGQYNKLSGYNFVIKKKRENIRNFQELK